MKEKHPHHHTPLDQDHEPAQAGPTGRNTSVEQESFGPGKDAPDPNELIGSIHDSPWTNKAPGSKRRW